MMYILSQDKKILCPIVKPIAIDNQNVDYAVVMYDYESTVVLGEYETEKRALAIVYDIANAVSCGYPLYCMPRE